MSLIDNIDKLKDISINRRDRERLDLGMMICTGAILGLAIATVALTYYGRETKSIVSIIDTLIWVDFGLVVVFVGGTWENRRVAARTMTPPIVVRPAEPTELAENVAHIADDVDKMANKKGKKK